MIQRTSTPGVSHAKPITRRMPATPSSVIVSREGAASPEDLVLLTPPEAAKTLGCSTRSLYRLIDEGELLSIRVGGLRRIPRSLLNECSLDRSEGARRGSQRHGANLARTMLRGRMA